MTQLNFDLPMYSFLVECSTCQKQSVVDMRAWDVCNYTYLYVQCPNCDTGGAERYHTVLDVNLAKDHLPLFPGEADPNSSITYAIKFIKTGGWIPNGYNFLGKWRGNSKTNWGVLTEMPFVQKLDCARRFYSKRSVKSTITRYINRSSIINKLRREDFEVYEILSQPVQKVTI